MINNTLPCYNEYLKLPQDAKDFFDFLEDKGIRLTIIRLIKLNDYKKMLAYFWSAIVGTQNSINFYSKLKNAGHLTLEDLLDEVRLKFN